MSALPNATAATSSPAASVTPTPTAPAAQAVGTVIIPAEGATPATGTFNAAQFESDFGLAPGSLAGVTDEAAAIVKVREFTDRALTAGIGFESSFVDEDSVPAAPAAAPVSTAEQIAAAAKAGTTPGLAELQKEVADLKASLAKQSADNEAGLKVQLNKRLAAVVDSWASPKYGVAGHRTYKQTKAFNDFTGQLKELVPGLAKTSQPIPVIETAALRLWSYDDPEGFDAHRKGAKPAEGAAGAAPLGTPGRQTEKGGDLSPHNIHEALYSPGTKSFVAVRR
jgi:hypothetical protein